jgi:16S rRNA G527 N7-methylase RsmG
MKSQADAGLDEGLGRAPTSDSILTRAVKRLRQLGECCQPACDLLSYKTLDE